MIYTKKLEDQRTIIIKVMGLYLFLFPFICIFLLFYLKHILLVYLKEVYSASFKTRLMNSELLITLEDFKKSIRHK